jgi:hypothetical protein
MPSKLIGNISPNKRRLLQGLSPKSIALYVQNYSSPLNFGNVPPTRSRNLNTRSENSNLRDDMPLSGVRVLELGQLIAGPFAGQLLG